MLLVLAPSLAEDLSSLTQGGVAHASKDQQVRHTVRVCYRFDGRALHCATPCVCVRVCGHEARALMVNLNAPPKMR